MILVLYLGGSTLVYLVRFQLRCRLGLQCSEGLIRAGGSVPWLESWVGCHLEAFIPLHVEFSTGLVGCPYNMAAISPGAI